MSNSRQEKHRFMSRRDKIIDDLKVFHGLPPYDDGGNMCRHDGYFARSMEKKYRSSLQALQDEVNWKQISADWQRARDNFMCGGNH